MTYTDHPEYLAQLAGIIAMPEDDLPRLVLADWLEERGESQRAEFIRVQCELAKTETAHPMCATSPRDGCERCRQIVDLRRRERELWARGEEWFGQHATITPPEVSRPDIELHVVRRGFVAAVRCSLQDWCGQSLPFPHLYTPGVGPEIVAAHPVERAELSGVVRAYGIHNASAHREDLGPLWPLAFPGVAGDVVEALQRGPLLHRVSAAAIAWAKDQPRTFAEVTSRMMERMERETLDRLVRGLMSPPRLVTGTT